MAHCLVPPFLHHSFTSPTPHFKMQLACVPTFTSLLAALPLAVLSASSSDPQLQRRHHHPHEPFTNVYIMKDNIDYSEGFLSIYTPDGKVAFQFVQTIQDSVKHWSTTSVSIPKSDSKLILPSTDDKCGSKTIYRQKPGPQSEDYQVHIHPEGSLKDIWRMSYTLKGVKYNFFYDRNYFDKDGKIYALVGGHKRKLIAQLRTETRQEAWLTHGGPLVETFTLSSTATAPHIELVAFMGLVAMRTYRCGT